MKTRELIVVGGGPAGMAAALSARNSGVRDILLLERDQHLGGILNQCVHTGFGLDYFKEQLTGPEYAVRFSRETVKTKGIEVSLRTFAVKLTPAKEVTYLKPDKLEIVKAKAIIMATGCRERTREMVHLSGTRPAGIFSAGLAQKLINLEGLLPGKAVVIVGSGDIGLIMARRFILEGAQVKAIIEARPASRGLVRNMVQCVQDFDIPVYYLHRIARINGRDRVESVDVVKTDETGRLVEGSSFNLACDTVLMSVGLVPENELLEMVGAKLDPATNAVAAAVPFQTSLPGIFACGNAFKVYDVVDSVTRDSEAVGIMAAKYLGKL